MGIQKPTRSAALRSKLSRSGGVSSKLNSIRRSGIVSRAVSALKKASSRSASVKPAGRGSVNSLGRERTQGRGLSAPAPGAQHGRRAGTARKTINKVVRAARKRAA